MNRHHWSSSETLENIHPKIPTHFVTIKKNVKKVTKKSWICWLKKRPAVGNGLKHRSSIDIMVARWFQEMCFYEYVRIWDSCALLVWNVVISYRPLLCALCLYIFHKISTHNNSIHWGYYCQTWKQLHNFCQDICVLMNEKKMK